MKELKDIQKLFFLGIGGIGMSALAKYFNHFGKKVYGYDKTETDLTRELEKQGINIIFETDPEILSSEVKNDKNTLIVYTPAIQKHQQLFSFFAAEGYKMAKRAEVLGRISKGKFTFAIAGTHGKTTTTAILAHLLIDAGEKVTAFMGGISENFKSNLAISGDKILVVEADEFDRSFLQLSPNIAAITSMDSDHLDIYGDKNELERSFNDFAALVVADGTLFYRNGLALHGISYGVEDDSAFCAKNVKIEEGTYQFDLQAGENYIEELIFKLPGRHNLSNAVGALAMALKYGIEPEKLRTALKSFSGVKRRFEYKYRTEKRILIDDYAHHPAEISAVFDSVKEMFPKERNLVVFQPHLFSRTRDFGNEFAESLEKFDEVVLLDIYPAREEPIEGITSEWLLKKINNPNKKLCSKNELSKKVSGSGAKIIVMLGAGDIGNEVEKVKIELSNEK